jgi:hypothetical protein
MRWWLAGVLTGCSLATPLDEYVRGSTPMPNDAGTPSAPTTPARVLIAGGSNGTETFTAELDGRGLVTGFTPLYRVSAEWSGAGFFDGELVLVNNDEVLRAPFDGGSPVPWTRQPSQPRPDGRGSIVVGRGVAIASMGENGENVWIAELTDAGLMTWVQQDSETFEQRRDPRVVTNGTFVWLIGGESPVGTLTPAIEGARLMGREIGPFNRTTDLPAASSEPAVGLSDEKLVVCGGSAANGLSDRCASAPLDAQTGQFGAFTALPNLPYGMRGGAIAIVRGRLTLFGAESNSVPDNTARIFSLELDGGREWERSALTLPAPRFLEEVKVLVP